MKLIKLGDYIELYSEKNSNDLYKGDSVRGISIQKRFTDTKANLDNLSLSNFNIVPHGHFAFNPNTARMGDKICVAYNDSEESIIVSSIYPVFRVTDDKIINPKYLMMFFSRSEFDRYVRFNSWGSAREVFDYDDFCNIKMQLPDIEIQNKFVAIYEGLKMNPLGYEKLLSKICPILIAGSIKEGKNYE